MTLNENSKLKTVIAVIEKDHDVYLKENGIQRSKFIRQAVEAHKIGLWKYDYTD